MKGKRILMGLFDRSFNVAIKPDSGTMTPRQNAAESDFY